MRDGGSVGEVVHHLVSRQARRCCHPLNARRTHANGIHERDRRVTRQRCHDRPLRQRHIEGIVCQLRCRAALAALLRVGWGWVWVYVRVA